MVSVVRVSDCITTRGVSGSFLLTHYSFLSFLFGFPSLHFLSLPSLFPTKLTLPLFHPIPSFLCFLFTPFLFLPFILPYKAYLPFFLLQTFNLSPLPFPNKLTLPPSLLFLSFPCLPSSLNSLPTLSSSPNLPLLSLSFLHHVYPLSFLSLSLYLLFISLCPFLTRLT